MMALKTKHTTLFLALFFGLLSCAQSSNGSLVSVNTAGAKAINSDREIWTLYAKSDTIFHVKRLVSLDSGYLLLSYDINTSKAEAAHQTFIGSLAINEGEIQKVKSQYSSFNWTPFQATPILFVQIKPSAFKDEMPALNKRQEIEQLINTELKSKSLGEWIAGDLGPGGANMLFNVQDIKGAKSIIQSILSKNGLDKGSIIGRRVNVSADDWFYEVIYPLNYNGKFITL